MPLKIAALDAASRPAWDRFVLETCPEASFFHLAAWKEVVEGVYRQRCHYLYAERDGAIAGVLPLVHIRSRVFGNRLISNAFTIGGGVAAMDPETRAALDAEAILLMRRTGASGIEYRRSQHHAEDPAWTAKTDIYANFSRPIEAGEEECLKQIPRKQRAVVRKALDQAILTDEIDSNPERFFPLYAFSMRNMGTPVFGLKFFERLMGEFAGRCDCLTVLHQGKPVSSVLNFYFRDAVMPYYTGCQPEARDLGANDFMYWRLMRHASERGFGTFDFGRSKFGTGPFSFKKNWGFEPAPITHEYLTADNAPPAEINPLNPKYRLFIALWRRLPLGLANMLGPVVVREIG